MSLSLRTPPLSLSSPTLPQPRKSQTGHFHCFSTAKNNSSSNSSRITGAPDLSAEVMQRIKSQVDERENALKKSKQMLFSELCNSLNLSPEEGKRMWGKMSPDQKLGLVKGFVSDWGLRFHPLSSRSVRDMVEEYVALVAQEEQEEERESYEGNPNLGYSSFGPGVLLPGLKKFFMGFSQD